MNSENDTARLGVSKMMMLEGISLKINILNKHNSWFQWALKNGISAINIPSNRVHLPKAFIAGDTISVLNTLCNFARVMHHDSKDIGSVNDSMISPHDDAGSIHLLMKDDVTNAEIDINYIIGYIISNLIIIDNNKLPIGDSDKVDDNFIWMFDKGQNSFDNHNHKLDKVQHYLLYDLHKFSHDYYSYRILLKAKHEYMDKSKKSNDIDFDAETALGCITGTILHNGRYFRHLV